MKRNPVDLKDRMRRAAAKVETLRIVAGEKPSREQAQQALRAVMRRLQDEVFLPNEKRIADITSDGTIAVLVLDPRGEWVTRGLPLMGWDGKAPVFAFNRTRAGKMASGSDPVTAAWLRRRSREVRRLLAVVHLATLLLNWTRDGKIVFEPGSLQQDD